MSNLAQRPLLLGHRGTRRGVPENTLEAFEQALAHGCDGFEFDVRRSADGRAVICHDARLGRRLVARNSYAALCQRAPALPLLEEVLTRFGERAYLYIELKVAGLEQQVVTALRAHPPQRGFVVASFLPDALTAVHACDRTLPLGFICDAPRRLARWRTLPVSIVMPKRTLVTPALVEQLHAAGKQVIVWTVNREREMRRLAALGVDGIVSDDTERLGRVLQR